MTPLKLTMGLIGAIKVRNIVRPRQTKDDPMHDSPTKTRLQQVFDTTHKSRKDVAAHLGIDRSTLSKYIDGTRQISLVQAHALMEYVGLDPSLLHNLDPMITSLTGLARLDAIITDIYANRPVTTVDPLAHYFTPDYRCCSHSFLHDLRLVDQYNAGADFEVIPPGKSSLERYGVSRAVEYKTWLARRESGQVPNTKIIQAQLMTRAKVMVIVETTWTQPTETKAWDLSMAYTTIDHLKFKNNFENIEACKSSPQINTKSWVFVNNSHSGFGTKKPTLDGQVFPT